MTGQNLISQTSGYALRAVCALASRHGELIPTSELSELTGVPFPYLAKVLQQLASADVIRGRRGVGGGYCLVRDPSEITMLDVVCAIGAVRKNRGSEGGDPERVGGAGFEGLERSMERATEAVRLLFGSVTIETIAMRVPELAETEGVVESKPIGLEAGGSA